jgi:hypothetical protein
MSEHGESFRKQRRFHTSIIAVISAVILAGAIKLLVNAAAEPLRPAISYVINWVIVHGRWGAIPVSGTPAIWRLALLNLGMAAIGLGLGLTLAYWNSRKPAS